MNWFHSVIDGDSLDQSELVNIKIFNFHFILLKAKKKEKISADCDYNLNRQSRFDRII